ncbi:hypothetical protein C8R45DRAFT_951131 [Mycena sanguinolenta]|nr:hypothetical protein C8R45DRAFT_951131 [Mycena sanguinolenta]
MSSTLAWTVLFCCLMNVIRTLPAPGLISPSRAPRMLVFDNLSCCQRVSGPLQQLVLQSIPSVRILGVRSSRSTSDPSFCTALSR